LSFGADLRAIDTCCARWQSDTADEPEEQRYVNVPASALSVEEEQFGFN